MKKVCMYVLLLVMFVNISCSLFEPEEEKKNDTSHEWRRIENSSLNVSIPEVTSGFITVSDIRIENGRQVGEVTVTTSASSKEVKQLDLQAILALTFKHALYITGITGITGIDASKSGVGSFAGTSPNREFLYIFRSLSGYFLISEGGGSKNFEYVAVKFTFEDCTFVRG